jgi:hypothetical protein
VIAAPDVWDEGAVITVGGQDTQVVEEFVDDETRAGERVDEIDDERRTRAESSGNSARIGL